MASLVGSVFQEYSTLNALERLKAVSFIGNCVSYVNAFDVDSSGQDGTKKNDLYFVNEDSGSIDEDQCGGEDIVISDTHTILAKNIESLILTGDKNLFAEGNKLNNTIAGNNGNNTIEGGGGRDMLLGGAGNDYIKGGAGDDTACGGSGDDLIKGGGGSDMLEGNAGNDTIFGGGKNDFISGGSGNDSLVGGGGHDTVYGDSGNDTITGGGGPDLLVGGSGDDSIHAAGGADTIVGGEGNDTLFGGGGDDIFYFDFEGDDSGTTTITDFTPGKDLIEVEAGLDTIPTMVTSATNNVDGNAVITVGNKDVVLVGVDDDDVDASFFHIS